LTRSGIISSVHSFATSNIGPAFAIFLAIIVFGSLLLLITRLPNLRSEGQLESVLSRESSFLFNNLILVGMAATVLFLTTFPILSEAVAGRKVTMGPPIFNMVNIPWALVLLALVGIGPLIAWRKASKENLKRNFVVPALAGTWVFVLLLMLDLRVYGAALSGMFSSLLSLQVAATFDELKVFYPAITFGTGAFVIATVVQEYWRGMRVRMRQHQEAVAVAFARMTWRNKRRYGGYIVHLGIVCIFFGIAGSSAYQTEVQQVLEPGAYVTVEDYLVRYDDYRLEAIDDHIGAVTQLTVFDRGNGKVIGTLEAEQRMHPNMQIPELRAAFRSAKALRTQDDTAYTRSVAALYPLIRELEATYRREVKTPSTEVGIIESVSPLDGSRWGEDFYVIPLWIDPETGRANFRIFVNPMINFIWFGGLIFVAGALVSILPDARERRRLEASMAVETRAVA
jgi:cytochrome c-type biogenesis protein CcmF